MPEEEKQEGQKTVVAFIAGLLIGGLLVWVFSSTPEEAPELLEDDTVAEEITEEDVTDAVKEKVADIIGDGSIGVLNQPAGNVVALGKLTLPNKTGWVVVRDYMDGEPGRILGAAKFDSDTGLLPTTVELIRNTEANNSYQVVYFTNEGDTGFNMDDDLVIKATAVTFVAE